MHHKSKNNDNKCFQYATTLALNFNKIDKHPQRISRIKPFIENYNWNDINFPTAKKIGISLKLIIKM